MGIALVGESGIALLLALLFWDVFMFYVRLEEAVLGPIYGESYHAYCLKVSRYLGCQGE